MKGITGHQMAIILSIIIAIIVIALVWVFLSQGSEGIQAMFDMIVESFYQMICGVLGSTGRIFLPWMCN